MVKGDVKVRGAGPERPGEIYSANHRGLRFLIEGDRATVFQDSRGLYVVDRNSTGNIPKISIFANNVPAAWELAMISVWDHGAEVHTHYDKSGDPPSREATVTVNVDNPLNEPRIHRNFPGGPVELESYRQEVVDGIHDHHIAPKDNKWTYTYHERLSNYNPSTDLYGENRGVLLPKGIDQINLVVQDLVRDITSKGAQATVWMPSADPGLESNRPCLQRLWFRVLKDDNNQPVLNMNSYWRSRDLAKAWFMNVHAITSLQEKVAEDLSARLGTKIGVGSYSDTSDSLHIYGAYFKEYGPHLEKMKDPKDFEKRVWNSDYPAFTAMTEEARENLAKDPDYYMRGGK